MSKAKSITCFIACLVLVVVAGAIVMWGTPKKIPGIGDRGKASYITQGLDLKGGTSITYQVEKGASAKDISDTRAKLEKRVQSKFSSEATAYTEGTNRITVEIPGAYDADKAIEELGKPGKMYYTIKVEDGYEPTEEELKNEEYIKLDDSYYKVWLTGDEVADAQGAAEPEKDSNQIVNKVKISFTNAGDEKFYNMTSANSGKQNYIIYNDEIITAPRISGPIRGGCEITGSFETIEEANDLATSIRIGGLKVKINELSHSVQSAQLGNDALSKSLKAGLIGFIIICIFLLFVYRIPGLAAALSLVAYVELMLLALNGFDLTLTLPGIAGIILDIGMAVDANVIIYARIREEIAAGRQVQNAIYTGFQKATSAIVDGNITTLIAALVLLWRGSGTVQGFATTLAIGILVQLFSSLVISRAFVWLLYYMGFQNQKFYGKEKVKKTIEFVQKKAIWFAISIVTIAIGLCSIAYNASKGDPFDYSIEFKGGISISTEFEKTYDVNYFNDSIKPDLEKILKTTDILGQQDTNNKKIFTIKTRQLTKDEFAKVKDVLIKKHSAVDKKQNFGNTEISDTISSEMRRDAVIATMIATLCMLLYIWIRFKNIQFALAAVVALVHDVLVVVGFYGISGVTVGTTFIACLLTIVGYSINATIVIFDRIRENRALMKRGDQLIDVVNASITQTLTRSIYTTLTTFVMIFMIFVMGVSSIREFTLPLMVGVIAGMYSSVCVTGSLWYVMKKQSEKKAE
ncbi:MAG: protein translocase subunit SecD [Eubacterium sp.]|nr:protein translocase subunit SecD [Eubacterium sp.]